MACRPCSRHSLTMLSRQAKRGAFGLGSTSTLFAITCAPPASSSPRRSPFVRNQRQQQCHLHPRRSFTSSPQRARSWIPKSVKDAGGKLLQSTVEPYQVNAATRTIYRACAGKAAYTITKEDRRDGKVQKTEEGEEIGRGKGVWFDDFGLPPTFSTWSQVTMLHLYLIHARARNMDPEQAKGWQQQLLDHFFFDAEEKMDVVHAISSRALRQRYLKDLFVQWRGVLAAYDEGVYKGDTTLAAAVWRNVYKAREDVDVRWLAAITAWMRRCLGELDRMGDEGLFFVATQVLKGGPGEMLGEVERPVKELEGLLQQGGEEEPVEGEFRPVQNVTRTEGEQAL